MQKTFKVISGPRYTKLARRACQVAIGSQHGATVWDDERGYALYPNTARKVNVEN
jgi:hypothetical protein